VSVANHKTTRNQMTLIPFHSREPQRLAMSMMSPMTVAEKAGIQKRLRGSMRSFGE
jgi:hypothetical protein